ncbi:MAG: VWA domain-containing protein [Methylococcales bacterium]|nr:VWA domain-containing protein [Methylococcales bacterium]
MSSTAPNNYDILRVGRAASVAEIEIAFQNWQSAIWDRGADPTDDPEYDRVYYAYEVLSNPLRREIYDSVLGDTVEGPTLNISVLSSGKQIQLSDKEQIIYLLVTIESPDAEESQQLPLNLCLVLDRSTSMRGERLEQTQTAVSMLIDKLSPSDKLSVISFSDRAQVVLPSAHVTEHQDPLTKIKAIEASGGTEIYQGLAAGVRQLRDVALDQYSNQLVLLTDGHTYGDADKCLRLATETAKEGIGLTAFGLGDEWNDTFLDSLVAPSQGQSMYIEHPSEIVRHMEERIQGLGAVYANNVRLQPRWPLRSELLDGFKLTPFSQPLLIDGDEISLGDVEGRAPLSFLLELQIPPQLIPTRIKVNLSFLVDIPGEQVQQQQFQEQAQFLVQGNVPETAVPPKLLEAVQMLNLYRINEKVLHEAEAGQLGKAATRMHRLSTRFFEAGEVALAEQAQSEAQRLAEMGTMSPEGRKRIKYGTRMLFNPD